MKVSIVKELRVSLTKEQNSRKIGFYNPAYCAR